MPLLAWPPSSSEPPCPGRPVMGASHAATVPYPDRMAAQSGRPFPGRHRGETTTSGQTAGQGANRRITWEGFANARDLGGLPARDGRVTRFGAYIRSGDLRFVTETGWRMARDAGVRTIIDLRNDDEIRPHAGQQTQLAGSAQFAAPAPAASPPTWMNRVESALDDIADTGFWQFLN